MRRVDRFSHPSSRRPLRLGAFVVGVAIVLGMVAPVATAAAPSVGEQTTQALVRLGTGGFGAPAAAAVRAARTPFLASELRRGPGRGRVQGPAAGLRIPKPATKPVVDATGTFGFQGLNHFDNRTAGTGAYTNTQFSVEPPDQGLCVGRGFVLETVNVVARVRTTTGRLLTPAVSLNQFFGLAPEIVRSDPPVFGPFLADPKCYFDTGVQRWFLTILEIDVDAASGDFLPHTNVLLAVSATANPTGSWNLYAIDTTNDGSGGTPTHTGCPCLGDQPLIGADRHGFYISTNEFPLFTDGFNGAMVYALSKGALAAGGAPSVIAFFQPTLAEGQAYSLQPTTTPPGASHAVAKGGTEYFLSALDFTGEMPDNRIALWALTNTSSLATASPRVRMQVKVIRSIAYALPPPVGQKRGPTPLRDLLATQLAVDLGLVLEPAREKISKLDSNDDRMNQTVFVRGTVWGALNTAVRSTGGGMRTGIAWFIVAPAWQGDVLGGRVTKQGYVAVDRNSLTFPAVAANAAGQGVMAFSLAGPTVYPSAAYVTLDARRGAGAAVRVVQWGAGPSDGFTGYPSLLDGGGISRWGDYSAAVADGSGRIWFATETINHRCNFDTFLATGFTCGNTRTIVANWGSFIARVSP